MLRKIISLITLAALLANTVGLTGCTAIMLKQAVSTEYRTATAEEVRSQILVRHHNVVVHTKQDAITFEKHYARYDSLTDAIVGYSKSHGTISVPLDQIIGIEMSEGSSWTKLSVIRAEEVEIPPRISISQAKLNNDSTVVFDGRGAQYLNEPETIQGANSRGTPVVLRVRHVDSVYFAVDGDSVQYAQSGRAFKDEQKRAHKNTFKEQIVGVTTHDQLIRFNKNYGRIDSHNQTVVGTTVANDTVNVPIDSVISFTIERANKNHRLLTILALAAAAGLTYLALTADILYGMD